MSHAGRCPFAVHHARAVGKPRQIRAHNPARDRGDRRRVLLTQRPGHQGIPITYLDTAPGQRRPQQVMKAIVAGQAAVTVARGIRGFATVLKWADCTPHH